MTGAVSDDRVIVKVAFACLRQLADASALAIRRCEMPERQRLGERILEEPEVAVQHRA